MQIPEKIEGVKLGDTEYTVVEQPFPRLWRGINAIAKDAGLGELELSDAETVVLLLGDKAYEALQLFIPNLMAKWKFHGYESASSYEQEEFNPDSEEAKHAPTLRQMILAFEAGIEVNGGKRLTDMVGKTLGPQLAQAARGLMAAEVSNRLATSPSTNGDSPSESSTTTLPTTEEPLPVIEGSPSPDSSDS